MAENLLHFAERRPDVAALVDELGETTWSDFNARTNRLIHALRAAGLEPGAAVAVLAGNRREFFELFAACAHAALVVVPINWHFVAEEIAYVLDNSDARALFVGDPFGELAAAASAARSLALRVAIGADVPDGFTAYEALLADASPAEPAEQSQGAVMFYTSGTTGRPKGVSRLGGLGGQLAAQRQRAAGFAGVLGIPSEGVTLVCGPVYHSAQWAFSQFPLDVGSTLVSRHRFDAAETLELIDRYRVTNVHLVPTQFVRLLRLDEAQRRAFDGSSLRLVLHGAAPCPPEVKQSMIDWWGPVITEYYGGTEGAVISVIDSAEWQKRPTSVGKPLGVVEVTAIGEDNRPCAPGVPGQLYIKSLLAAAFEYHKDPDKTRSVHREAGVFTMGDIGYLDRDGYLHLTDRKIDMIISGGVNIYPAEIERVLGDHPAVADVAVFGVPDEEYGEQVKAVVLPRPGHAPGEELARRLLDYCRERLAGYKVPRSLDFVSELPRQATGKLYKRLLRERYWQGRDRRI